VLTNNHVVTVEEPGRRIPAMDDIKGDHRSNGPDGGREYPAEGRRHRFPRPRSRSSASKASTSGAQGGRARDSDELEVGDQVIAIGDPFGLKHGDAGIISAKERTVNPDTPYAISSRRTLINPGYSAGRCQPKGEAVGINTAIIGARTTSGSRFDLPVKQILPHAQEKVGWTAAICVFCSLRSRRLAEELKLESKRERSSRRWEDGPAAQADSAGDVIVRVDDKPINDGANSPARSGSTSPARP